MSDALFDLPNRKHAPPPAANENLSADRQRTRRQRDLLALGYHPLTIVLSTSLPLHADAAPHDDLKAEGARCGSCRFRVLFNYGPRTWPKCTFGGGARKSHGGGTDVRAWWPACRDYQAADGGS